jgi:hypothetical protein
MARFAAQLAIVAIVAIATVLAGQESKVHLDEKSKQTLVHGDKEKNVDLFKSQTAEFYMNNPITEKEEQCFSKLKLGQSIDFVIDLAPCPSCDEIDKRLSDSPLGLFMDYTGNYRGPSQAYFDYVRLFIEAITFGLPKPECSHSIIYDKGLMKKFFIRGRSMDSVAMSEVSKTRHSGYEFNDVERNLKTMWPVPTGSKPHIVGATTPKRLSKVLDNNLGRLTYMALWNRDNGLPTVLAGSERSNAIYTVIITDGSSGAKINELTKDFGRTSVIDIGERRFVDRLSWDEMKSLVSVVTLPAPQALPAIIGTIRNSLCWLINKPE